MQQVAGFWCGECGKWVSENGHIGTAHRNHCPFCLWSKHLDLVESGDRKSVCLSFMKPRGFTFKHEGYDKYDQPRQGELMIVHQCIKCGKISLNRVASDDLPEIILSIFENSLNMDEVSKKQIESSKVELLTKKDEPEIKMQLFGKKD